MAKILKEGHGDQRQAKHKCKQCKSLVLFERSDIQWFGVRGGCCYCPKCRAGIAEEALRWKDRK